MRTPWLPFQGPIPPIRGKCPEGTKGVGMLSAQLTERLSPNSENLRRCAPLGSPERGAVSAQPRLRGCRRFAIKPKPQIQFAVWKGRTGLRGKEAPRTAGTRSVEAGSDAPSTAPSFPSCRKRWGRKGALGCVWCMLRLNLGGNLSFRRRSTRESPYVCLATRRLIRENQISK